MIVSKVKALFSYYSGLARQDPPLQRVGIPLVILGKQPLETTVRL
jgi:hypothetical protein